jgi:hypothetical protein
VDSGHLPSASSGSPALPEEADPIRAVPADPDGGVLSILQPLRSQIGIQTWMVFPVYVFSGDCATPPAGFEMAHVCGWAGGICSDAPYFRISGHFNEIVWDRRPTVIWPTRTWISQSSRALRPICRESICPPERAMDREIVVRVYNLVGITGNPNTYAQLREGARPFGRALPTSICRPCDTGPLRRELCAGVRAISTVAGSGGRRGPSIPERLMFSE